MFRELLAVFFRPSTIKAASLKPRLEELEPRVMPAVFTGTGYVVGATVTASKTTPQGEESIAVDPTNANRLLAAVSDFSLNGYNTTKYQISTDGGATWTDKFVPLNASLYATTGDGKAWPFNSDPVVAIDKAGHLFLADLYFQDSDLGNNANGLYVSVGSFAGGFTTAATKPVAVNTSKTTTLFEDKEWIAVDNSASAPASGGNVYVSWSHFVGDTATIFFSRSTDHGTTWSAGKAISVVGQDVQGSEVAVGPNGEVYVTWEAFGTGSNVELFIAKSTDGGQTFSAPKAITPIFTDLANNASFRKDSFPSLAVNPLNGEVVIVYSAQVTGKGQEVLFIRSKDGGATFSVPTNLNDVASGDQFMPSVAIDKFGVIHVSWFDTRSTGSASRYNIYATYSKDNGATFAPNAKVTAAAINASSTDFIGDYAGIAAANGVAHPIWIGPFTFKLQTATLKTGVTAPISATIGSFTVSTIGTTIGSGSSSIFSKLHPFSHESPFRQERGHDREGLDVDGPKDAVSAAPTDTADQEVVREDRTDGSEPEGDAWLAANFAAGQSLDHFLAHPSWRTNVDAYLPAALARRMPADPAVSPASTAHLAVLLAVGACAVKPPPQDRKQQPRPRS